MYDETHVGHNFRVEPFDYQCASTPHATNPAWRDGTSFDYQHIPYQYEPNDYGCYGFYNDQRSINEHGYGNEHHQQRISQREPNLIGTRDSIYTWNPYGRGTSKAWHDHTGAAHTGDSTSTYPSTRTQDALSIIPHSGLPPPHSIQYHLHPQRSLPGIGFFRS